MLFKKVLNFIQEIGTIMYVGGILSHIVIGVVLAHPDASTVYHVYLYKLASADILILPGLAIKIVCDLILFFQYKKKPNWLKLKMVMMTFLTINAFVFLVPMMPELLAIIKNDLATGIVSQAFLDLAYKEQLVGMSNVIPLILELVLGSFKPKIGRERA
jgi:hypothetical protein